MSNSLSKENTSQITSDARCKLVLENINKRLLWTSNDCINCGKEKNFICLKCNDVRPKTTTFDFPYCLLCLNSNLNLNDLLEDNKKCFENMMQQILHICKTHKQECNKN